MKLQAQSTTYSVDLEELKKMFAERLEVEPERVTLRFKTAERGDDRFGQTWQETVGIDVTVSGEPPAKVER